MKYAFYATLIMLFTAVSCSKEEMQHGIKGRVVYKTTGEPYANSYVEVSYYSPSSGMGFLTAGGTLAKGYTDADGNFKLLFHVKKYHLEEGSFSIKIIERTIYRPITEINYKELEEKRIVNVGTIQSAF